MTRGRPTNNRNARTQDTAAKLGFEAKLWEAADALRNNMDAAEYKHVVLGLIFLKGRTAEVGEADLAIMALIDRQYPARPYYGARRMAAWLATQGHVVNRKTGAALGAADGAGGDLPAPEHEQGSRRACQRRWKTKPHGGGIVGQFGIVFSDGRDRVSALARALTG